MKLRITREYGPPFDVELDEKDEDEYVEVEFGFSQPSSVQVYFEDGVLVVDPWMGR